VELMVHPGASYSVGETSLLRSGWVESLSPRVELINYRQLDS
jgi:hypothetical protein